MKFTPHKFQQVAVDHAVNFLTIADRNQRVLYAAPTGSGKSVVELCVQKQLLSKGLDTWVCTPREEIAEGMLDKLGCPDDDMVAHRICTPIRLRNMVMDGKMPPPQRILFDESHHSNAETWQQLSLLTGMAPMAGYTATPYRGSPRSTREFREFWGDPLWLISYEEAQHAGYIQMPEFTVLPLVDDDIVEVTSGGEFEVTSVESATLDRLADIAEHSRSWYSDRWTLPTVFAMPSTECCVRLQRELSLHGLPSAIVSAATPRQQRLQTFEAAAAGVLALLHINIVTEGVDFPFKRLVDLAPTMSPVKWVQQLGRCTRPNGVKPVYVCTNRNLMRHAYVLEGIVPTYALVEAEKKFPQTERAHGRVLGLEAIGRFKPTSIKLTNGLTVHLYAISVPVATMVVEYCVVVHPTADPLWVAKVNTVDDKGVRTYGSWAVVEPPLDVQGFSSVAPSALSEKQKKWWERSAAAFGIDPTQDVNRKNFQLLPVLCDTGMARLCR